MSDHEAGGMPSDEDLSLPKATVTKMIAGTCSPRRVAPMPPDPFICKLNDLVVRLELLPNEITCAKETRDLIIECCVGEVILCHFHPRAYVDAPLVDSLAEFIHLISSEANEICEQESKKTIAPEHIISALKVRNVRLPLLSTCGSIVLSSVLIEFRFCSDLDLNPSRRKWRAC